MADVFTDTALTDLVKAAYNRVLDRALRAGAVFDQFANVKPTNQTAPGSTVTFTILNDLAQATTALTETTDPDFVAPTTTPITVTLNEYGNVVASTRKLRATTFAVEFDAELAEKVAYNAVDSIDRLARNALDAAAAGQITFAGQGSAVTAETQLVATDILDVARIRSEHAELKSANVPTWDMTGNLYVGVMHPDVAFDIKQETGDGSWLWPHQYVDTGAIYVNEIGTFGGFKWIESTRVEVDTDAGSGAVDSYSTYFIGRDALAKAEAVPLSIEIGTVSDKLNRFFPIGWYNLAGWGIYRAAAGRINKSAATLGTNV